jgi:hypothetical protein
MTRVALALTVLLLVAPLQAKPVPPALTIRLVGAWDVGGNQDRVTAVTALMHRL